MIIDLEKVRGQLHRLDSDDDDHIVTVMDSGVLVVTNYLKVDRSEFEDESGLWTMEDDIGMATLLVIESLYEYPDRDPITEAVKSLLIRHRDPALA